MHEGVLMMQGVTPETLRPYCINCLRQVIEAPDGGSRVTYVHGVTYVHAEATPCRHYYLTSDQIVRLKQDDVAFSKWCQNVRIHLADLGRPFRKCAYCGHRHLLPTTEAEKKEERFRPCLEERFVLGVLWSFPMLRREAPGLAPWKPEQWAKWWRTSGAQTSGSYHAVAFVLSVWAGENAEHWKRRGYSFDFVRAWGVWDDAHRAAFLKWAERPWRP